jgi:8-oxo-dGTP diphosphatase
MRSQPDAQNGSHGKSDALSGRPLLLVVAAALVDDAGRVLVAQRPQGKSLAGMWEFPGGKIEPGESPEAALVRELAEELDVKVRIDDLEPAAFASHAYEAMHLLMPLYLVRRWGGEPRAVEAAGLVWAAPTELQNYVMPPADAPLVRQLIAMAPLA